MVTRSARVVIAMSALIAATEACTILTDWDGFAGAAQAAADSGGGGAAARADADVAAEDAATEVEASAGSAYAGVVLADGPIAYLRLGESAGVIAKDQSANGRDGTLRGSVTLGAAGAIAGDVNTAFRFPGNATGIDIGTSFAFPGNAAYTLEAWARVETVDGDFRHLFTRSANPVSGRDAYGVFVQGGSLVFERYVGGASYSARTSSDAIVGRYAHVVAAYDGAFLHLYVDGVQLHEAPDKRSQLGADAPFRIGSKTDNDGELVGDLDEVAIYDKALPAARITAHYEAGKGAR